MNLETAQTITKQWYSKAAQPSLDYLLNKFSVNDSGGQKFYRPFIVAALMMRSEQKTLIKGDVAIWELNKDAFKNLLSLQSMQDATSGLDIPFDISVDNFLESSDNSLGFMIV